MPGEVVSFCLRSSQLRLAVIVISTILGVLLCIVIPVWIFKTKYRRRPQLQRDLESYNSSKSGSNIAPQAPKLFANATETLADGLGIASKIAQYAGVPFLGSALKSLSNILTIADEIRGTSEQARDLKRLCRGIIHTLLNIDVSQLNGSPAAKAIEIFQGALRSIANDCGKICSHSTLGRYIQIQDLESDLASCRRRLNDEYQKLMAVLQVNLATDVHLVGKVADQIVENIDDLRGEVQEKIEGVGAQVAKLQRELQQTYIAISTEGGVPQRTLLHKNLRSRSQSI
ncbi:hypothetical protein M422DRAFT_63272 [Sphaerobolus stellatus SS14]|nr:hypothetical protein M422DRAFT_63272 [Sphaerobolus stellatus SS14]